MALKTYFLFLIIWAASLQASEVARIPLDSIRMPSDDLIYNGKILTPEQAFELSTDLADPIDLSKLSPMQSEVWKDKIIHNLDPLADALPLSDGDKVKFGALIQSPSGLMRFNVTPLDENRVYTVMMEKTLHTTLMKKNLLRKLGFIVPKIKYLKSLSVVFTNHEEKVDFLKRKIPEGTFGAPSRWIDKSELEQVLKNENLLKVTLKDVAVLRPQESDHFNFALGVPPRVLTSRITRSLIIPYSLLEVGESVNKVNWFVGQEKNQEIVLPHSSFGYFQTTMDDAHWMLDRLEQLSEDDYIQIVEQAYFPKPVELLLIEKIKSRRNSLLKVFKRESADLKYNAKISDKSGILVNGKILRQEWPQYASRFAHGSPDSPFQDFEYFVFSKLQTAGIENLLYQINDLIKYSPIGETRSDFLGAQFQEGLQHFVDTGEMLEFPVKTWFAPSISGGLIANRDIVIGNYMGTDNLVQLADTFGASVNLGAHLGIENLPIANNGGFLRAGVSLVKTWTHLKPVKTLKASFKEPYRNIIVPLVKLNLKRHTRCLAEYKEGEVTENCEEYLKEIEKDDIKAEDENQSNLTKKILGKMMEHINESLGVGESIVITEKIIPNSSLGMIAGELNAKVAVGVGANMAIVKRVHLYRKDADHIQIYDDNGKSRGFSLNFSFDSHIPVLNLEGEKTKGNYELIVHTININPDVEKNPKLFENAQALYYLLNENSTELLAANEKPLKLESQFNDRSTKMSFLVWRSKYLKGNSIFQVENSKGKKGSYLTVKEEGQSGINYEKFAKDLVSFYLSKLYKGLQINGSDWQNPAHTFKGVSESTLGRYESKLDGENNKTIKEPFISLTHRKEGWSLSKEKLKQELKEINDKYGRTMFDQHAFEDAQKLRLYNISMSTNIYEKGIGRIKQVNEELLLKLQRVYKAQRRFLPMCNSKLRSNIKRNLTVKCGHLASVISQMKICRKNEVAKKDLETKSACWLSFSKKLESALEFKHFIKVVGEDNLFIHGNISGFRQESEILADPINSNTIGKIGSRYWNGPVDAVRSVLGIQPGEFSGSWIRESL